MVSGDFGLGAEKREPEWQKKTICSEDTCEATPTFFGGMEKLLHILAEEVGRYEDIVNAIDGKLTEPRPTEDGKESMSPNASSQANRTLDKTNEILRRIMELNRSLDELNNNL